MNRIEIRELSDADLDRVCGAGDGWVYCPLGSTKGGDPGVYPSINDPCATNTLVGVVVEGVLAGAKKAAAKPQ
jgi:hypothetical protein